MALSTASQTVAPRVEVSSPSETASKQQYGRICCNKNLPHSALSLSTISTPIGLSQIASLPYPRQHAEPLLLILAPEILPIPHLLLPRPDAHLRRRDDREQNRAPTPRHQRHPHPRHRFEHVVRTRHQSEAETLRYPPLCSSCGP